MSGQQSRSSAACWFDLSEGAECAGDDGDTGSAQQHAGQATISADQVTNSDSQDDPTKPGNGCSDEHQADIATERTNRAGDDNDKDANDDDWQALVSRIQDVLHADPVEKSHVITHLPAWLWLIPPAALVDKVLPVVLELLHEKNEGPALQYDEYVKESLAPYLDQILLAFFSQCAVVDGRSVDSPALLYRLLQPSNSGRRASSPSPSTSSSTSLDSATNVTSRESEADATMPIDAFSDVIVSLLLSQNSFVASNVRTALVRLTRSLSTDLAAQNDPIEDDDDDDAQQCAKRACFAMWEEHLATGIVLRLCHLGVVHPAKDRPHGDHERNVLATPSSDVASDIFEPLSNAMDDLDCADDPFASPLDDGSSTTFSTHDHHHDDVDLFQDDEFEERVLVAKLVALRIIADLTLSELVTNERFAHRFLDEVSKLADDEVMVVRKEAVEAVKGLAVVLPALYIPQVLETVTKLSHDETWHVRQALCRAAPSIFESPCISPQALSDHLEPLYKELTLDAATAVQIAALDVSGPLIYLFHRKVQRVPDHFIDYFVGRPPTKQTGFNHETVVASSADEDDFAPMPSVLDEPQPSPEELSARELHEPEEPAVTVVIEGWTSLTGDHEKALARAFNLPAVTLSLGSGAWPQLRDLYEKLLDHPSENVRRSLAASLFELLRLVRCQAGSTDEKLFITAWQRFVGDTPAVQTAAVAQFGQLLEAAASSAHFVSACVSALVERWESLKDWRTRESAASQLFVACEACVRLDLHASSVELWLRAANDSASVIRQHAATTLCRLVNGPTDARWTIEQLDRTLTPFAEHVKYRQRSFFCRVVAQLATESTAGAQAAVVSCFADRLRKLAADKIVDVRLAVCAVVDSLRTCEDYAGSTSELLRDDLVRILTAHSSERCIAEQLIPSQVLAVVVDKAKQKEAAVDNTSKQEALTPIYDAPQTVREGEDDADDGYVLVNPSKQDLV